MTNRRFRFTHKDQGGFTLIELIVAIAIAALITAGITAAIMQVLTINTRASNHMVAVRQVQQAGKEVSKDTLQSQSNAINASPSGGDFLVLGWTDWEGLENVVVYTLQVMPSRPDLRTLERSHTINGTEQATAIPVVAEYIDPVLTSCVWNVTAGVLTFTVTAALGTESETRISETRIYEVEPRPE